VGNIAKKQSEGVRILLIRDSKYNAMLLKIHYYRLLFSAILPTEMESRFFCDL